MSHSGHLQDSALDTTETQDLKSHTYHVVCFLLGNSPVSEFYV